MARDGTADTRVTTKPMASQRLADALYTRCSLLRTARGIDRVNVYVERHYAHLARLRPATSRQNGCDTAPPRARAAPESRGRRRDLVVEAAAGLVMLVADPADDDQRRVRRGGLAVDEPLGAGRRLAADDTDRRQLGDLVGERHEPWHRPEGDA